MHDIITFFSNLFSFDKEHPLLFTQFNFWFFFLLVLAGYSLLHSQWFWDNAARLRSKCPRLFRHVAVGSRLTLRNGYLFVVSLFFYFKTSGLFVMLLILATFMGHFLGRRMDALAAEPQEPSVAARRKAWAVGGVVVNLLVLCYFKYAYFFTDIYNNMFNSDLHVVNHLARFANSFTDTPRFDADKILLPVGISFFTFQNISYIVDVYKRKIRHVDSIWDFGFYTTFFPQLVAGPIVRAEQFVSQIYKPFFLTKRQFGVAIFWILNGLVKKMVLSDYLAVNFVDKVFDNPSLFTAFHNLSALLIYSLQVYADFSGYTDIAIGAAMLMGFYLPKNFNSPYKATNPAGFWKRWHISLSNWLKDYLYIPLGGNRSAGWPSYLILGGMIVVVAMMAHTVWVTIVALLVIASLVAVYFIFPRHRHDFQTNVNNMDTMLLGGLWHGASFNYITWGGLNGLGILVYKWWKRQSARARVVATMVFFAVMLLADIIWRTPFFNMMAFAAGVLCAGTMVRYFVVVPFCNARGRSSQPFERPWNILLTFFFVSFTRLFFRSGSNLDPAEANRVAWQTAKQMVNMIGGEWHLAQVPEIVASQSTVFIVFLLGMIIHWLPDNFKRCYRLRFASMSLWAMAGAVILTVFVVYQFATAEMQPFIYFQF